MSLVEKRYAEAMAGIAEKHNALDIYQQELEAITGMFETEPDFSAFLLNPETGLEKQKTLLQKVFKGRITDETLNLLMLLLDKSRIRYLPGICEEYVKLADGKRNILKMSITSAAPLVQEQLNGITEKFRKLYNASSVKTSVDVDAGLIGGVRVVIGDKLIDDTVKGRLEQLRKLMTK